MLLLDLPAQLQRHGLDARILQTAVRLVKGCPCHFPGTAIADTVPVGLFPHAGIFGLFLAQHGHRLQRLLRRHGLLHIHQQHAPVVHALDRRQRDLAEDRPQAGGIGHLAIYHHLDHLEDGLLRVAVIFLQRMVSAVTRKQDVADRRLRPVQRMQPKVADRVLTDGKIRAVGHAVAVIRS